ncbi:hypothetical protein [Shimazuella alba]|uniref:Uncharacterized protein n=1 Tax=Shimazuella alba TaxID=2690964 RepID=A0A6I4VT89_9BACL|nr:hypothetical protein [Shimazuella alba]MXQ54233.1 hypothetical protein [Shimazuella alba]
MYIQQQKKAHKQEQNRADENLFILLYKRASLLSENVKYFDTGEGEKLVRGF